jgi:ribonuclease HI
LQAWGFSWLNLAGKTVLIKLVLNSLPIYQASLMLAPLRILRKMEGIVRSFFWKGGKQNRNRLPLVNWDKVTKPFLEGGLNFKDMRIQNLALGSKILWRQVAPKAGWAQRALWKKYFSGSRKRSLDRPCQAANGSQIHKLCMQAQTLIQDNLFWVPGNGKSIDLWEDRIMNEAPLADVCELHDLHIWMKNAGLASLWDISICNDKVWLDWMKPKLSSNLENAWLNLRARLKGKAPIHEKKHDQRGWGKYTVSYSVALGYKMLRAIPYAPPCPAIWKGLWKQKCIPKIDLFNWLLCHNRILTADNLMRKGFHGPSRCCLCLENKENAQHIMLNCKFALEVWGEVLNHCCVHTSLPSSIFELHANWTHHYPGQILNNSWFKIVLLVLPKLICWQIWLERNNRIFQGKKHNANIVKTKILTTLKDFLKENIRTITDINLSPREVEWGKSLGLNSSNAEIQPKKGKDWQIRMPENSFSNWNKEIDCYSLLFDGAAKGNPGNAGAGGVIKNIEGQIEHRYTWGLDQDTNTQAEAMALMQGLKILQKARIKEAKIIGDSQTLIKMLVENSNPKDLRLARLMVRIKKSASSFQKISFFHVLRNNNKEADAETNRVALLPVGTLLWNDKENWDPIPQLYFHVFLLFTSAVCMCF